MSKISEGKGVEIPVYQWLGQMGWTPRTSAELKQYNRPLSNPIIDAILIQKVQEINGVSPADAKRAIDILKNTFSNPSVITGNEDFLDLFCNGVNMVIDGDDRTVRFIDFENVWNNDFTVTRQYYVQGTDLVKPDLVCLVNGVPLIPFEAKQRAHQNSNWLKGVSDLQLYESKIPRMIVCNLFGMACNGRLGKYGIPGASSSYFAEWKDLSVDTTPGNPLLDPAQTLCPVVTDNDGNPACQIDDVEKMKQTVVGLLQPPRVLDILQNFIVFERTDDKGVVKKVTRYQQLRVANKIVQRVVDSNLDQGIAWHTQGSGKSLSMLFCAFKLRGHPKLGDPTVYLIVDRKDLRQQIGETFEDCLFPNTNRPLSIPALKAVINNRPAEVIITTIQKFQEMDFGPNGNVKPDDRDTVIILIDEAHRTQYGYFHSVLKAAFPNAKRFAFTGTPIPKTQQEFGAVKQGKIEAYLDRYSIDDAIKDGATVPVNYAFGPTELFLDREKLKAGYAEITEELDEEEKKQVERRVQPWKEFLKTDTRIERLAQDIAEDFRNVVEPDGFKAMVVTVDKEGCRLYYDELLKHFRPDEIAVVISHTGKEAGEERFNKLKDFNMEDGELKALLKRFKKRITPEEQRLGNNLKVLIVCNMLLTGFDAPVVETMYLDSPLCDHNLLQAIARTNRPYDDSVTGVSKQFGRVVDYVGVFKNYREALAYEPEDMPEFKSVDEIAAKFPGLLETALKPFEGIALEDSYECSIAIVRKLQSVDQTQFEKDVRDVIQNYEALSPHALLADLAIKDLYEWVLTIYQIYLTEFKRSDFDAELYAAKTRKLIRECAKLKSFVGHLPEIAIDERYLENLRYSKLSSTDKAEKIIRDIETIIRREEARNPAYVEFDERLAELIRRKRELNEDIETVLRDLEGLFTEVDEVGNLPTRMGFADRGRFDLFLDIKHGTGNAFDEGRARQFVDVLVAGLSRTLYAGWQESDLECRRVQTDIKTLADGDDYESLSISGNDNLVEVMVNRLAQHYAIG
jgi:type I restriction enzyme R subunit